MLSGEGNENGEKNNNRSNQQKNNFARAAHFFVHSFAFALNDHNVKLPETSQLQFLRRKCRTCCCSLFFTRPFSPWWPLGFLIFSPPLKIFHVVLPTNSSLSSALALISVALFLVELRQPVAHFIISLYSKFVDMTINLSVILQTTRIQKQFLLSVFVFIDSFSFLCFTRRRWLCDFPPK